MIRDYEEPFLIDVQQNHAKGEEARALEEEIRRLSEEQPFAVLATQGKGITDASLISFASSPDLKHIVFATPRRTGKFDLIAGDENVSILVDDRSVQQSSINQISALTITGRARALSDANEILKWAGLLTEKHPNLAAFVMAPTTALILVEVANYLYVKRFQEVWVWKPI